MMRMHRALTCLFLAGCTTPQLQADSVAGTCAYPAFVADAVETSRDEGPDFFISGMKSERGIISVYQGCCSSVSNDRKTLFTVIDGQNVYRTAGEHGFSGYLTIRVVHFEGSDFHYQAHFFGDGLYGDERDKAFFKRMRLGDYAAKRCDKK